jgi:hypothetical protein
VVADQIGSHLRQTIIVPVGPALPKFHAWHPRLTAARILRGFRRDLFPNCPPL